MGEIKGRTTLHGFQLSPSKMGAPPSSCEPLKSYLFNLHLVLAIKANPRFLSQSAWINYFDQCQEKDLGKLNTHFSLIADFLLARERIQKNKLGKYLKEQLLSQEKLDSSQREKILRIFKNKRDLQKASTVNRFSQLDYPSSGEAREQQGAEASHFFSLNELIKDFEKSHNQLLSKLVSLRVALGIGNKTWASDLLESIIHYDFYRYIFDVEYEAFSTQEQRENFKNALLETLKSIFTSLEDKTKGAMLLQNFANYFENEKLQSLRADMNAMWSLKFMRKQLDSESYGKSYLNFWYSTLHGRTTTTEIFTFLKGALTEEKLKELPIQSFWVFNLYFPSEEKKREIIYKRIQDNIKKDNPYIRHLMIRLAKKEIFREKMGKWSKRFRMAHFQMKREFYREQLEKGMLIHYAIYELVQMGDYDPYHLWWLAL